MGWPRSNTPPCDRPPDPWLGLSLQQQLIPTITNLGEKEKESLDPIEDMGKYIHIILDSDDEEAKQCKQEYNTALAMNTKMHIIHDNLEHLSELEKGKIEEMERKYNPKSEERFKETWDLSVTKEEDSIVKNLCENLEKLNLETNQESDNSDSSTETVIEYKIRKLSPEKEKCQKLPESDASLSPIRRGEESSIVHSLGRESKTKLDSATGTEDSKTSPQNSSRKYKYGTQVVHEENCDCPYCYIRNSAKKQKLSFSINAAQMVRMFRNTKCSSSRPTACS